MDPVEVVVRAGGLASAARLRAEGCSEYAMTVAVRYGRLSRVRKGWYSVLPPNAPRIAAVQSGGLLTGISALHEFGAWVLDPPQLIHVAVPAHSSSRACDPRIVLHWEDPSGPASRPGIAALGDALVRVVLDEPLDIAVPCLDWAVSTRRLDRIDFERVLLRLPASMRGIRSWTDPRSQSVLESVARVRLLTSGWSVRSQVSVAFGGAIDLVIEDEVALELDGKAFHERTFESDRRKDLAIASEGRHAIRISMAMLRHDWARIETAITASVAARRSGMPEKSGELPPVPRRRLRARNSGGQVASESRE